MRQTSTCDKLRGGDYRFRLKVTNFHLATKYCPKTADFRAKRQYKHTGNLFQSKTTLFITGKALRGLEPPQGPQNQKFASLENKLDTDRVYLWIFVFFNNFQLFLDYFACVFKLFGSSGASTTHPKPEFHTAGEQARYRPFINQNSGVFNWFSSFLAYFALFCVYFQVYLDFE